MVERRPRNRKQQILSAASELFRERGYHNVAVSDVTTRVSITASALYRHYRNKNDLLYHTVLAGIDDLQDTVDGSPDLLSMLSALSATSANRRGLPLLWQREARYLQDEQRAFLRKRLSIIVSQVFDAVHAHRPELPEADCRLVAFSLLAVFSSSSSHRIVMSQRRMEALMLDLATRVALCPLGSGVAAEAGPPENSIAIPVSRREQLLAAAIRLFDDRGYRTVNNEDIGEACGTTGPNMYNHFDTKLDLLVTAITRGFDRRDLTVRQALSHVVNPRDTLAELLPVHIAFAIEDGHLLGLMATELGELPDNARKACLQAQRDYLSLWVRALLEVDPDLDTGEAQFTISAAMTLIGNAARVSQLHRRTDLADRLTELCTALLTGAENPAATQVDQMSGRARCAEST